MENGWKVGGGLNFFCEKCGGNGGPKVCGIVIEFLTVVFGNGGCGDEREM